MARVFISTSASSSTASTVSGLRSARSAGRWRLRPSAPGRPLGCRQPELGGRALARLAVQDAVVRRLLGHAMDHRQAEAGALADALGGEERLGGARQRLGVHALAGVVQRQPDIVPGRATCRRPPWPRCARRWSRMPPSGMASRALTARLSSAVSSWCGRPSRCEDEGETRLDGDLRAERALQQVGHAARQLDHVDRLAARAPAGARRPACAGSARRRAAPLASRCRSAGRCADRHRADRGAAARGCPARPSGDC